MLIEEYLSPTNMTLCETVDSSQNTNSNSSYSVSLYMMEEAGEKPSFILTKNKAIFLSCLYLEGIGIFAKVTSPSNNEVQNLQQENEKRKIAKFLFKKCG